MDRSSRRERLGLVAIAIAALASAATSYPPPTPHLLSSEKGTISLTAETPIAWLEVMARENDALTGASGSTTVKINAEPQDTGVLLIAANPRYLVSDTGAVQQQASCSGGEGCSVRLTAILVDPAGHPNVDVRWTATAETRFPDDRASVPAAILDVEVGPVASRPAVALGLTSTRPERIELGPELPRAARNVRITLPAGPVPDSTLNPGALLRTTNLGGNRPGYSVPVTIRVLHAGDVIEGKWSADLLSPFVGCDPGAACEVDLIFEFDWNGGSADGSAIEWALAAWPGVTTGEPAESAAIVVSEPTDVAWARPALTASMTGQSAVTRQGDASIRVTPTLDLSDVPEGVADVGGLVRLKFLASLGPGEDPASEIVVSINRGVARSENLRPGQTVVVYSKVEELGCTVRSSCRSGTSFDVLLRVDSSDHPDATVDWTAELEFVPLTRDGVPDGSNLRIDVESPSP